MMALQDMILIEAAGPLVSLQDQGRKGWMAQGVTASGALDMRSFAAGNALLGHGNKWQAAIELVGFGGTFRLQSQQPRRMVLSGANCDAKLNDQAMAVGRVFTAQPNDVITLTAARKNWVAYLHCEYGFATPTWLGSQAMRVEPRNQASRLQAGTRLPLNDLPEKTNHESALAWQTGKPMITDEADKMLSLSALPSCQSHLFDLSALRQFLAQDFTISSNFSRQAVALKPAAMPIMLPHLSPLSEIAMIGDLQWAANGELWLLLQDCQTMAGYPRVASLPIYEVTRLIQAAPGTKVSFSLSSLEQEQAAMQAWWQDLDNWPIKPVNNQAPLNLLDQAADWQNRLYQASLISGAITGDDGVDDDDQ